MTLGLVRSAALSWALALLACGGRDGDVLVAHAPRTPVKLIGTGHDMPRGADDLARLQKRLAAAEATPFDGLVVDVGIARVVMTGKPLSPADTAAAEASVAVLDAIPFRKLTDNFQALHLAPVDLDWFDDEAFAALTANAALMAGYARRGHLRGFFVDNQVYGARTFAFDAAKGRAFADVERQVAARGEAVMRAFLRAFPDVTLVLNWGYSEMFRWVCIEGQALETHLYALYPAFLDGLVRAIEAEKGAAVIVDGYLPAYPTRDPEDFTTYYNLIHARWGELVASWRPGIATHWDAAPPAQKLTTWVATPRLACPAEVQARLARERPAGFGVMMDYGIMDEPFRTDPARFGENRFTPAALEASVSAALARTDRYVWIWNESFDWWGLGLSDALPPPAPYVDALARARATMIAPP